ncbi:MAG TPA: phosphoglycerate dehydrogenase [Jatrophihabitantaceae bacterium]|jgi:D-3-phosphoglycerate dehydrogenase|nr:phosphoglycerate dehydrogenase [Jatrophihabitantaceae bacterium]
MKVLVAEQVGEPGVELLRGAGLDVVLGHRWDRAELETNIADFDAILIRSATQVDADLLAKADRLRVVARAGVGVDNVDVDAATRRGVVVANAPQSNVITAAEHTMALLLALARNVPQAHASLTGGAWDRGRFTGVELHEKTLGIIGFGRIGQLVAHRARGFGMRVIAFDVYLAAERFRELGVERATTPDEVYAIADFITIHLPKNKETEGWLNAAAFAQMKDGVRILNVARGPLVVDADLQAALDSGKVAGAALDVFRTEPVVDHPLFAYPNVIVTPHLGASTSEATDRAGYQAAEQIVAALTGGAVTSAVNLPSIAAEDLEAVGPFLGLCTSLGAIVAALAPGTSIDAVEVEFLGRIAERDTRLLTIQVIKGVLAGHTEEIVHDVNALTLARERGIAIAERSTPQAHDFTDLVRVELRSGAETTRVVGTLLGRRNRPHLLEAWGSRFNVQLDEHLGVFRYRDQPGMLGRVGTALGDAAVNVISAAVGRQPGGGTDGTAVMVVTVDDAIPSAVLAALVASPDFFDARAVSV